MKQFKKGCLRTTALFTLAGLISCASIAQKRDQADLYLSHGNPQKAYEIYERIYRSDPDDLDALCAMAKAKLAAGEVHKASAMFNSILRMNPGHDGAEQGIKKVEEKIYHNLNQAWALYLSNEFENARQGFLTILDNDHRLLPESALWRVHLGLGYVSLKQKNFQKALDWFEQAHQLSANADTLKALGQASYKNKGYLDALDFFAKSLEMNPEQSDVLVYAGLCFLKRGHEDTGLGLFRTAFEKDAAEVPVDDFLEGIDQTPSLDFLYCKLGWALFHDRMFTQSLTVFETAFAKNIQQPDLLRGAGYAAFSAKLYKKSARYSQMSLELYPDLSPVNESVATEDGSAFQFYSNAQTTLAWTFYYLDRIDEAKALFETAVKKHPDWPDPLSGLGWICLKQKEYDAAESWFEKAITIDPAYLDAHAGKKSLEKILSAAASKKP